MERSILNEMTDSRLSAYLRENRFDSVYWPTLFPLDYRDELTWESLSATAGANIKADIISYDSSAPEKGREVIGKASGKIAKTAVKRSMREEDLLMYRRLKKGAANSEEKKKILELVFGDVDFVVNAVNSTSEFLALQGLSTGRIYLDKTNNNGLITETAVDLGIQKENKTTVSVVLNETSGSLSTFDFLKEVKTVNKAARAKGVKLNHMFMDQDTIDLILETELVKKAYGYFLTKTHEPFLGTLFQDDLNKLLAKNKLPQISIIDTFLRHEDKNHKRDIFQPWQKGYITFMVEKKAGRMQHGPIAEEEAESVKKYAIQAKKEHVLVTKFSTVDPVVEWTKGEGHFFPVLMNPEDIYILNTNSTTKFI